MGVELKIFRDSFDFEAAIEQTKESGYFFASDVIPDDLRIALEEEVGTLPLETEDRTSKPINAGKPNEVRQQHERLYVEYGDDLTPVANLVITGLAEVVRAMGNFPELQQWRLTEIGYQRYRPSSDFIGAHRDRASDKLLSVTYTITGSAPIRIFETVGDYWDYSRLEQSEEFITTPGSVMLLRAPGFGSGEQAVHQVLPPTSSSRSILNLRMRPNVLEQPSRQKREK